MIKIKCSFSKTTWYGPHGDNLYHFSSNVNGIDHYMSSVEWRMEPRIYSKHEKISENEFFAHETVVFYHNILKEEYHNEQRF